MSKIKITQLEASLSEVQYQEQTLILGGTCDFFDTSDTSDTSGSISSPYPLPYTPTVHDGEIVYKDAPGWEMVYLYGAPD